MVGFCWVSPLFLEGGTIGVLFLFLISTSGTDMFINAIYFLPSKKKIIVLPI